MEITESGLTIEDHSEWDVDALTEEIWLELDRDVSRTEVELTILNLFARYEDAPVKHFVPVVVRRKALLILREEEQPEEY
jgi:hypothetical protein